MSRPTGTPPIDALGTARFRAGPTIEEGIHAVHPQPPARARRRRRRRCRRELRRRALDGLGPGAGRHDDAAPKGFRRGRFSLGDQLFLAGRVVRDGTVKGTSELVATVSDRRPVAADRAHGFLSGTYHLADGDLYFQGTGLFDEAGTGRGAIVGGTGAYAGARGTIESTEERDVIHLLAG